MKKLLLSILFFNLFLSIYVYALPEPTIQFTFDSDYSDSKGVIGEANAINVTIDNSIFKSGSGSVYFNGTTSLILYNSSSITNLSNNSIDRTISIWAKIVRLDPGDPDFLRIGSNPIINTIIDEDELWYGWWDSAGYVTGYNFTNNEWRLFTFVIDSTNNNMKVYLDGVFVSDYNESVSPAWGKPIGESSAEEIIGIFGSQYAHCCGGYLEEAWIDDLRIYENVAFNSTEVEELYNSYIPACINFSEDMVQLISPMPVYGNITGTELFFDVYINTTLQTCYSDYNLYASIYCSYGCYAVPQINASSYQWLDLYNLPMNETHYTLNLINLPTNNYSISVGLYYPSDTEDYFIGTDNQYPTNPTYYLTTPIEDLTNDLTNYYPLDENANDIKGTADGIDIGSYQTAFGINSFGRFYNYTGITRYDISRPSSMSYSLWMFIPANETQNFGVAGYGYSGGSCGGSDSFNFRIFEGVNAYLEADCGQQDSSYVTVSRNVWHHIVVNSDNGVNTWYLDSVLQPGFSFSQPVSPYFWIGGAHEWSGNYYGNVKLDEVALFDGTRTQEQVDLLYNSGVGLVYNGSGWVTAVPAVPLTEPVRENITAGNGSAPVESVIAPPPSGIIDYTNVTTLQITAPTAGGTIDFTGQSIDYTAINTTAIIILPKSITINPAISPELNKPATLTFTGVGPGATVLRNGQDCGSYCRSIRQTGATLIVDVTGFSTYTVSEEVAEGCSNVRNIVFAAFAIFAIIVIITAAFLLVQFDADLTAYIALAISSVGFAIVLFVGYVVISKVQYAICVV